MKRSVTAIFAALLVLSVAGAAFAQEEAHYEGYFVNSAHPAVNPNPGVLGMEGRGLVTAIYPPLLSNFVTNEYTWVATGLLPIGNTVSGTTTYTTYDVVSLSATFTMYEDPSKDASPTFYNCPADVLPNDPRYSDGAIYLKGHFVSFVSQYDTGSQTGTFQGNINWDSGTHLNDLGGNKHGVYTFGGTTSFQLACIPFGNGYDQAMTGRMFAVVTAAPKTTWGDLRRIYGK